MQRLQTQERASRVCRQRGLHTDIACVSCMRSKRTSDASANMRKHVHMHHESCTPRVYVGLLHDTHPTKKHECCKPMTHSSRHMQRGRNARACAPPKPCTLETCQNCCTGVHVRRDGVWRGHDSVLTCSMMRVKLLCTTMVVQGTPPSHFLQCSTASCAGYVFQRHMRYMRCHMLLFTRVQVCMHVPHACVRMMGKGSERCCRHMSFLFGFSHRAAEGRNNVNGILHRTAGRGPFTSTALRTGNLVLWLPSCTPNVATADV